jgi:hypothetical protein
MNKTRFERLRFENLFCDLEQNTNKYRHENIQPYIKIFVDSCEILLRFSI